MVDEVCELTLTKLHTRSELLSQMSLTKSFAHSECLCLNDSTAESAPMFSVTPTSSLLWGKIDIYIKVPKFPRVTHGKELCKTYLELLMGNN